MDVDERGDGLDGVAMLGVVEEVALAALVFGVPFEDVELRVVGVLRRGGRDAVCGLGVVECGGGVLELGLAGAV